MNKSLWYVGPEGAIYEVRDEPQPGFETDIQVWSWGSDAGVYKLNFTSPFPYTWEERLSSLFNTEIIKRLGGEVSRLGNVGDIPVLLFDGPAYGYDVGRNRVWLLGSRDLDNLWSCAEEHGRIVNLRDIPFGSFLIDVHARLLIEHIYGEIVVDRDNDIFLCDWRLAARYYRHKILARVGERPYDRDDLVEAMNEYLRDKRLQSLDSQLRISYYLFGNLRDSVESVYCKWKLKPGSPIVLERIRALVEDEIGGPICS